MLNAMILAAGRGERLRPLTDRIPKPLVSVAGRSLIEWHLNKLDHLSIDSVVINHAWLGNDLESHLLERHSAYRLPWHFSAENGLGLETGGGILKALEMLSDPFILINGDIFTEFDFSILQKWALELPLEQDGKLVLVENPAHNPNGDFSLINRSVNYAIPEMHSYTFAGMSVLRHRLFSGYVAGQSLPLRDVLRPAIERKTIEGVVADDVYWIDVGTPERLQSLRHRFNDATPLDQI